MVNLNLTYIYIYFKFNFLCLYVSQISSHVEMYDLDLIFGKIQKILKSSINTHINFFKEKIRVQ